MRRRRLALVPLLLSLATAGLCGPLPAAELPAANRIVFLGDSITYGGGYIQLIEAAAIARHPERRMEFLNLGLSSETVSGLSEEGHAKGQFPRPHLMERLDRVLAKTKPDLVIACYGMNDGIYYPLGSERKLAYQKGMLQLRRQVLDAGARIIHLTPAVFDPVPITEKVLPAGLDAYPTPYSGYDEVLTNYAEWLLEMERGRQWRVLDVHGAMTAALKAERSADPLFTFSRDGIHPNAAGHAVMARPLLAAWGLRVTAGGQPDHPFGSAILDLIQRKQALLRDAWLTATGHKRPGVKDGLPLPEAEMQAAELDRQARALAGS